MPPRGGGSGGSARGIGHERMTVAMELAAALHHSCSVRPDVSHKALMGQRTVSSVGVLPGELVEPGTKGRIVAALCLAIGAPSLSLRVLAGQGS